MSSITKEMLYPPDSPDGEVFFVRRRSEIPQNDETKSNGAPIKDECAVMHVVHPLLIYMKIVGLNYTYSRPAFRPFLKVYCYVVFFIQIVGVIRFILHINPATEGLNATTTLKLVCIIYFSIGAFSSFILMKFQNAMIPVRAAILRELPPGSELPEHENLKRISKLLVVFTLVLSIVNAVFLIMVRVGWVKMPPIPTFISVHFPFYFADAAFVFLTQSSMMMAASIFTVFCLAVRKSAVKITHDMKNELDSDDVFRYQKRYQALTDATELLEKRYSYYILYIYAATVPMVSVIFFTILRGSNLDFGAIVILLFWSLDMVGMLLFVSIPPILLNEQGDKLLRCCYKMCNHINARKNPMVFQQSIQFLVSQIKSTPLSMTAGKMFTLSREMLLTLFSQILTYFIILLQSG